MTLSRKTPVPRSRKPLKRSGPIKPKRRTKADRERIYGPKEKAAWMHGLPCHFCGISGYTQICHAQTGGMGRKDDHTRTFPACGPHPFVDRPMTQREVRAVDDGAIAGWVTGSIVEGCHAESVSLSRELRLRIAASYQSKWEAVSRSPQTETRE